MENIAQILEAALLNPDANKRTEAERQLNEAASNHFVEYLGCLVEALANRNNKVEVRMLAGLGLKNQLTSKNSRTRSEQQIRWINLDVGTKSKIKQTTIDALLSDDDGISNAISQLVATIAIIELPRNEWPELIPIIVENTKVEKPLNIKRTCLLTIGYICESSDPNNPEILAQSNGILVSIVQGAQSDEPSTKIRLTALNALANSLEFIKLNFEHDGERNYIMQVVCEATQADDNELQAAAFGCLAKIMQIYYRFMQIYMEKALYGLTLSGMQSPDEKVACMAIEFWSTVCEEEFDIASQRHELQSRGLGQLNDLMSFNFCIIATSDVLPTLLNLLTKQNEDPEDDDWSVAMAAGACLQLFAQSAGFYVVEPTLQFVAANIVNNEDWRYREAAVMAFGSILEGIEPDQAKTFINEALGPILPLIKDETLQVKETVAWCLGRIVENLIEIRDIEGHFNALLESLVTGLSDHPKVSTNCCWSFINLLEHFCVDAPDSETSILSPYYEGIVPILVGLTNKTDNEYSSRTSAYEALSSFVTYSANDTLPIIQTIASEAVSRLESSIPLLKNLNSIEAKANLEELQIDILALLTCVIRRLKNDVLSASDSLMELFIKLLEIQDPNSLLEEDIFIAISSIASAIGPDFNKYMPVFLPYLTKALTNTESPTCDTAIGLVADLAQSLGQGIEQYWSDLMQILGSNLNDANLNRDLRPTILSCFGDIAAAIGPSFVQYAEFVLQICVQASQITPEDSSIESFEYVSKVKESVLDAYMGIVNGLSSQPNVIYQYVGAMFQLIESISTDPELLGIESIARTSAGLLGDVAAMFPNATFRQLYSQDWVTLYIKSIRSNPLFSESTKDAARWARDQQKRQLNA